MFDIDTSECFLVLWAMFNTFCTHSEKHIAKMNNQMWHFCIHQTSFNNIIFAKEVRNISLILVVSIGK